MNPIFSDGFHHGVPLSFGDLTYWLVHHGQERMDRVFDKVMTSAGLTVSMEEWPGTQETKEEDKKRLFGTSN